MPDDRTRMERALADYLLQRLPVGEAYRRIDFNRLPLPVAHYLGGVLDRRIAREAVLPESDWFDANTQAVQEAAQAWHSAVRNAARVPAETWETTLRTAARQLLTYLVDPVDTLADWIFADGPDDLPIERVRARMAAFPPYPYLREIAENYLDSKGVEAVHRPEFERLLRSIDRRMVAGYDAGDWMILLQPLFELVGVIPDQDGHVPTGLLLQFFQAKGLDDLAHDLAGPESYTTDTLRTRLLDIVPDLDGHSPRPGTASAPNASTTETPAANPDEPTEDAALDDEPTEDAALDDEPPTQEPDEDPDRAAEASLDFDDDPEPRDEAPVDETAAPDGEEIDLDDDDDTVVDADDAGFEEDDAFDDEALDDEDLDDEALDDEGIEDPDEPVTVGGTPFDDEGWNDGTPDDEGIEDATILDESDDEDPTDPEEEDTEQAVAVEEAPWPDDDDDELSTDDTEPTHDASSLSENPPPYPPPSGDPPQDGEPLWKRLARERGVKAVEEEETEPDPVIPIPEPPAPPPPDEETDGDQPLWKQFAGAQEEDTPIRPPQRRETLTQLETRVLGQHGSERRDWYKQHLAGGDEGRYAQLLRDLDVAPDWTTAVDILGAYYKRERVTIYSDAAVAFTDDVEARYRQ